MTRITTPTLPSAPLDPALAAFLDHSADNPPMETLPPPIARQAYRELSAALGAPTPAIGSVTERSIDGPGGALALRLYTPQGAATGLPLLLYLHGGGWVIGDLETHDAVCRTLCHAAQTVVVAVDYRCAPEHPFPAALDDAQAALSWLAAHAGELGGDATRIAVAGDSAGAQLAAALAQRVAGTIALRAVGLIYPVAQHYDVPSASCIENEGKFLSRGVMVWFTDSYLAARPDAREHPDFKLVGSPHLGRLPPTWLATMGHDPLRDQGHELARDIAKAGVPIEHHHYPEAIHACIHMTALAPVGAQVLADLADWLREA